MAVAGYRAEGGPGGPGWHSGNLNIHVGSIIVKLSQYLHGLLLLPSKITVD